MTEQMERTVRDVVRSVKLWHIWTRLGLLDLRMRFRRSAVGPGWVFLNLSVLVMAIGFIYANLLGQDAHYFIPYLTAGLILWNYLTNSIVEGGNAFVNCEGYIKQISLPIYLYVFRFFVSIGTNACISALAFVVVALAYRVRPGFGTLWAIPGAVILAAASFSLILILAHLNARFRDVAQLAGVLMQVGFYVTPVLFPASLLRARGLNAIFDFNPLYHFLEVVRQPLLFAAPASASNYIGSLVSLALLLLIGLALMSYYGRRIVFAL